MSSVYRVLVDSTQRQRGHAFNFTFDVSRVTTSTDFRSKSWMCGVEWCDIVKYAEGQGSDFTVSDNFPRCMLLTCPNLRQHNTYESWSANTGSTLALLQSYMGYGIYNMTADQPYLSRNSLGCYIQGDRLNQLGGLQFQMMVDFGEEGLFPCLQPDSVNIFGFDYTFSLVFWEVKQPIPERPISPYYDFYKLLIRSSDRMAGGTAADCYIPLSLTTSGSMGVGTWQLAVEACSIIRHGVFINEQARGMSIVSDNFRDPYGHQVIGHLSKSDDGWYGLRMTNKPVTRDLVGVNVSATLDGMASIHIGIRDSETLDNLNEPENVDEWLMILTFYRVD